MRTRAEDTSPAAEREWLALWRQATPARKAALVLDTTRALQEFLLAGLRQRYPHASGARLRRRLAEEWLGSELARKAYGPFHDDSGAG